MLPQFPAALGHGGSKPSLALGRIARTPILFPLNQAQSQEETDSTVGQCGKNKRRGGAEASAALQPASNPTQGWGRSHSLTPGPTFPLAFTRVPTAPAALAPTRVTGKGSGVLLVSGRGPRASCTNCQSSNGKEAISQIGICHAKASAWSWHPKLPRWQAQSAETPP